MIQPYLSVWDRLQLFGPAIEGALFFFLRSGWAVRERRSSGEAKGIKETKLVEPNQTKQTDHATTQELK